MFSLLWKASTQVVALDQKTMEDLNLGSLFSLMSDKNQIIPPFFDKMPIDLTTIRYRQEIVKDFADNRSLFDLIKSAADTTYQMQNLSKFAFEKEATLYNLLKRVDEAEKVMGLIEKLGSALTATSLFAEGLIQLKNNIETIIQNDFFVSMKKDIQYIKGLTRGVQSITLGINLDVNLNPVDALLLSLNNEPIKYGRTLKKINKMINGSVSDLKQLPRRLFAAETVIPKDALSHLETLILPAMKQLIDFCDQFIGRQEQMLSNLKEELEFYQYALKIGDVLTQSGYKITLPEWSDHTHLTAIYNMNLAIKMINRPNEQMVYNNYQRATVGGIHILTGSNRGGKTTYTQAIGQCHWLGQLGIYVPAQSATMKVIDGLFVHFPAEETDSLEYGRLGEECKRFAEIYSRCTAESLVLMNESFSGTSHLESLTIAEEVVKALKIAHVSVVFNTHLHELGDHLESIQSEYPSGPPLISLVAGDKDAHHSFAIHESKPLGLSYANEIAMRYGVSYKQLMVGPNT